VDRNKFSAHLASLRESWRIFLERLADVEHPHDSSRQGWGPEDEWWIKLVNYPDGLAAAYVAWNATAEAISDYGPLDDARLVELIEPCLRREKDRRTFLARCKREAAAFRTLAGGKSKTNLIGFSDAQN
jgi:hypothetical protein